MSCKFVTNVTAPYASHEIMSPIKAYIIVCRAFFIFSSSPTASTILIPAQVTAIIVRTALSQIIQAIIDPIPSQISSVDEAGRIFHGDRIPDGSTAANASQLLLTIKNVT